MIFDKLTEFCDATALDTTGTDADLTGNVIDLGTVTRDIGQGRPVYLVIAVDTAVTSLGDATVNFALASDAQAAIAKDGSATIHFRTGDIGKATLVAGYQVCCVALPMNGPVYERYLGILATTGTAALTAGKINAFLTLDPTGWKAYPDGL